MPTITYSLNDLYQILGKKISVEKLKGLLELAKAEIEEYNQDEITISFSDTNAPYLWSIELLSLFLKGVMGLEKGIPKINVKKSDNKLIVDSSVNKVRPYIFAFVAKGKKIDEDTLKQMINLQEKICENYGRRREKVAIGIYRYKKIKFPIHYKAINPTSMRFVPLDFDKPMTQKEILERHPKGKEYGWILKDFEKFPILFDSNKDVLSFPPIINSERTGRIEVGDDEIFFEATGTDFNMVLLATNIFAYAFYIRGFDIFSVDIRYPNKTIRSPQLKEEKVRLNKNDIIKILGIKLSDSKIKELVEMMRYDFKNWNIVVPPFRHDVMHPVDVIEDIAIMYRYENFEPLPLTSYTKGSTSEFVEFVDRAREIMIGLGYQEIVSAIISNKDLLYKKTFRKEFDCVEIENPMSENYSVVRSSIIPILLEVISKNKHVKYPQKIFEEGIVAVKKKDFISEYETISALTAHSMADFTEAKQVVDCLLRSLGISCEYEDVEHPTFINGRVAKILVNKKEIGFVGEISPKVLDAFEIVVPVAGFEINLSELINN